MSLKKKILNKVVQQSPIDNKKQQRTSIFDTHNTPTIPTKNQVEYIQAEMNQVSLSPIRKFSTQM